MSQQLEQPDEDPIDNYVRQEQDDEEGYYEQLVEEQLQKHACHNHIVQEDVHVRHRQEQREQHQHDAFVGGSCENAKTLNI